MWLSLQHTQTHSIQSHGNILISQPVISMFKDATLGFFHTSSSHPQGLLCACTQSTLQSFGRKTWTRAHISKGTNTCPIYNPVSNIQPNLSDNDRLSCYTDVQDETNSSQTLPKLGGTCCLVYSACTFTTQHNYNGDVTFMDVPQCVLPIVLSVFL